MAEEANRRQFPRVPIEKVVLVDRLGDAVDEQVARTLDLSLGGCLFSSPRRYEDGTVLQLAVRVGGNVVEVVARVKYVVATAAGWDVGASFVLVKDKDRRRIAQLLESASGD